MNHDLLLSSGFLAFGRHVGFLAGVEDAALPVGAVVGTSSGALVGALWCAGLGPDAILALLTASRPTAWLRPCLTPWRGLSTLDPLIAELRRHLPPRFEDLPRPFAVGVVDAANTHRLLSSGPLPEAVAASCAVPWLFAPPLVDGQRYRDGAVVDRVGLAAWRAWRPDQRAVLHLVGRTHGAAAPLDPGPLPVVHSPPSGARLWDLGPAAAQAAEARAVTVATLAHRAA
jgi:predicted acylesterase/phospholipase RssA